MKAIEKLVNDFQKEHRGAEKNAAKKVHEFMMEKAGG